KRGTQLTGALGVASSALGEHASQASVAGTLMRRHPDLALVRPHAADVEVVLEDVNTASVWVVESFDVGVGFTDSDSLLVFRAQIGDRAVNGDPSSSRTQSSGDRRIVGVGVSVLYSSRGGGAPLPPCLLLARGAPIPRRERSRYSSRSCLSVCGSSIDGSGTTSGVRRHSLSGTSRIPFSVR